MTNLEQVLTSYYKDDMIAYLKNHLEDFDEAVSLAISDKQPYSWRAAWLLFSCIEPNDPRVRSKVPIIINSITTKKDGHKRELLKILFKIDLDEEYEGLMFDICISLWEQINLQSSVRFTAFRYLTKIANKHPELFSEIELLTEKRYLDKVSAGIKRSIQRLIREIPPQSNVEQ